MLQDQENQAPSTKHQKAEKLEKKKPKKTMNRLLIYQKCHDAKRKPENRKQTRKSMHHLHLHIRLHEATMNNEVVVVVVVW